MVSRFTSCQDGPAALSKLELTQLRDERLLNL